MRGIKTTIAGLILLAAVAARLAHTGSGMSANRVHGFGRVMLQNSESITLSDVPVVTV